MFKECKQFFDGHISGSSSIELFLKNIRSSLKVHSIALEKKYTDWNAIISARYKLDNEEKRNEDFILSCKFSVVCKGGGEGAETDVC